MINFLIFSTKNNFVDLFAWVLAKAHFPLEKHLLILYKLLFNLFEEVPTLQITENKGVSYANNFVFDDRPLARWLIETTERRKPKTD